ncbi:MAG: hypothetical protein LBG19_03165 [Prevotellaceae bacterium]|jgi:hypothetical protein|nr:hypothetical protein [Prevotellaceae bacterium]
MTTLLPHLKLNGIIIVDDAYIDDSSTFTHPLIVKHSELLSQLQQAGVMLIDKMEVNTSEEVAEEHGKEFDYIQRRCKELIVKYPDKTQLFEDYVKNQRYEYDIFKDKVICLTMVIKRNQK